MASDFFWLSSSKMTVGVEVARNGAKIVKGPPIVRKFIGQPIGNLTLWLGKQGGFKMARLSDQGCVPYNLGLEGR